MSAIPSNLTTSHTDRSVSQLARTGVLLYGIGSYAIGVSALVALILACLGVLDLGFAVAEMSSTALAVLFNVGLLVAFAFQHSAMARKKFKDRWTKIIRPSMERSTYVLATGVVLLPLLAVWQPLPDTVWSVEASGLRIALYAVALIGWTYLFVASFAINHFELFGLQQVWNDFRGRTTDPVPFKERWMYRFDRHPIMTGMLLGLWATPDMSVGRLVFSIGMTIYVVIGVYFEERALLRQWGDSYEDYRRRVKSIVPSFH